MGSLPQALARLGHAVTVILPKYRETDDAPRDEVVLDLGHARHVVGFVEKQIAPRVTAVLVDAPDLFQREGLYGNQLGDYADNALRFAVLSRGAIEYIRRRGERPSVIHAHDWQAGLVPAYQKMFFSDDPVVGGVPVGLHHPQPGVSGTLLRRRRWTGHWAAVGRLQVQAMEFWGQISFLKAGINFSERLTTVSPRYAKEILDLGHGLRIRRHA